MTSDSPKLATDDLNKWMPSLDPAHEPEKTISSLGLEAGAKPRASLNLHRLGYEIGVELGRGGMGLVNSARQEVFDREVAVKRLISDESHHQEAMKFYAEAVITAQLEHPHIVPIHDLMSTADGKLQLVMKRVNGFSWRDLLHPRTPEHRNRAKSLTLNDHLDIMLKVCDAVSFAHEQGVLHRDIKPENIMVGSYGEVLVMDWGCAVVFGDREHHSIVPRVEEIKNISGTPSYIAPEMVTFKSGHIGTHSDVYLLGAVLYEVLTLKKPNHGADVYQVLRHAVLGEITPPGEVAPERKIPLELADICMAALAKKTTARIGQVSVFADRIKDYRQHAQAVVLVNVARTHLAQVANKPRGASELLRKAVSCAEQALEIWPGWKTAKMILLDAILADTRHHLAEGAASLAAIEASRAGVLARELEKNKLIEEAKSLSASARAMVKAQLVRQQQLRMARIGTISAGVVLVIGLSVFLIILGVQQRTTTEALKKAELALSALQNEQQGRSGDQKTSAPALVLQARTAMAAKDWVAAITALRTAIEFDSTAIEAHQLLTNVLAATKRYDEVKLAGEQWQTAAEGDITAMRIMALSNTLKNNVDDVKALEFQTQLLELFEAQKLFVLADNVSVPKEKRLEIYRKRVDSIWPGAGSAIDMRSDELLVSRYSTKKGSVLMGREDVIDLEPLSGMKFSELWLSNTNVKNLQPLIGMPLELLSLDYSQVSDLSPLKDMPLSALRINFTKVKDLSPLAGIQLKSLRASSIPCTDLSPLAGMPLKELHMVYSQVFDLTPLVGAPLEELVIGNVIRDISPLKGMPLRYCSIVGQDIDLSPLEKSPLEHLTIFSSGIIDLSKVPKTLTSMTIGGITLRNPADLARFKLKSVKIDAYRRAPSLNLRFLNGVQLDQLNIEDCQVLDLSGLNAPKLTNLILAENGNLDYSSLAKCPLKEITFSSTPTLAAWRSIANLQSVTTLETIYYLNKKYTSKEFWSVYQRDSLPK